MISFSKVFNMIWIQLEGDSKKSFLWLSMELKKVSNNR
jgi:hypothetical protein